MGRCQNKSPLLISELAAIGMLVSPKTWHARSSKSTQKLNPRIMQAPEIQTMYQMDKPVAELRTKMRQEFERHRYVGQLKVIDVLLFQSHAEFQVRGILSIVRREGREGGDNWADLCAFILLGNVELLEAIESTHEVFPSGGGSRADEDTEEFHRGVFGGEFSSLRLWYADWYRDGIDYDYLCCLWLYIE